MWREMAQIIHLTDMHLHVDDQGNMKPPHESAKLIRLIQNLAKVKWGPRVLQELAKGLYPHSGPALRALLTTLNTIVGAPRAGKLIVVQSGDLEAYGPTQTTAGWAFPAFDYVEKVYNRLAPQPNRLVGIYGNHDVWPGTLPLLAPRNTAGAEASLRAWTGFSGGFSTPMPDQAVVIPTTPYRLEIYRLNTVQSGCLTSAFAEGKIDSDPLLSSTPSGTYPLSCQTDPIAELRSLTQQACARSPHQSAVRLLLMHHPPHFFNATGSLADLKEGRLTNAQALLPALSAFRFHLVIAGHRHALNPAPGTTLTPVSRGQPQPPLPYNTVQLVAGSPTQLVDPVDERPSFSIYALYLDPDSDQLRVARTVYRFHTDLDRSFVPDPVELLVNDLSIT